jgi:hypothetical protein
MNEESEKRSAENNKENLKSAGNILQKKKKEL